MELTDEQVQAIKAQRSTINDAIENNSSLRETRTLSSLDLGHSYHAAILAVSLGLGAAIIPLLLTLELRKDHYLFFSLASILLLLNSVYLVIVLKGYTEGLSIQALSSDIKSRYDLVRLRNMLTKAILTRDGKYFSDYNFESRKLAESIVSKSSSSSVPKLGYSTDISAAVVFIAIIFIARPLIQLSDILYFTIATLLLYALIINFIIQNNKYKSIHSYVSQYNDKGLQEENEFNEFVAKLKERNVQDSP